MKVPFIVYAGVESLFEKISTRHNDPKKSTTKISKHIPSGYSFSMHFSFDTTRNKLAYYRVKNCMKNFCLNLKKHPTKIINYEKKNDTINNRRRENTLLAKKKAIYAKKDLVLTTVKKIL